MRKKAIVVLLILYVVFLASGIFALTVLGPALISQIPYCVRANTCVASDSSGRTIAYMVIAGGILSLVLGSVLGLVAWIGTLAKQAKQEQWGWFICTLLFSSICML